MALVVDNRIAIFANAQQGYWLLPLVLAEGLLLSDDYHLAYCATARVDPDSVSAR